MYDPNDRLADSPFQDASFADLFETVIPREVSGKDKTPTPQGWTHSHGKAAITPSLTVTGCADLAFFYAKPRPALVAWLREKMLVIDHDHYFFEVVVRKGGEALILCKYGQIIGSRWIAVVPADQIPS